MTSYLTVYMLKGSKGYILCTQYTYMQCCIERVERLCYVHNIDTLQRIKAMCEMMSKESKEALTVLIVIHVIHVERVESGVCSFYTSSPPKYAVWAHNILTPNFPNIQRIFNSKKFWKAET